MQNGKKWEIPHFFRKSNTILLTVGKNSLTVAVFRLPLGFLEMGLGLGTLLYPEIKSLYTYV